MTADESLTGGRRARRARAMNEETSGRRRGSTGALLVRRSSVAIPPFDSPMPVMERFEARTLAGNRPFIQGATGQSAAPGGQSTAPDGQSAFSTFSTGQFGGPSASSYDASPGGDDSAVVGDPSPKKKSGWGLFGRKKPVVAPNANVDVISAGSASDSAEPDYDIETANATDTTAFDPSELAAYEKRLKNQTTEEAVQTASVEPEPDERAEEALVDAVSDEAEEHQAAHAQGSARGDAPSRGAQGRDAQGSAHVDTKPAGLVYNPESIPVAENGPVDPELGAEDPARDPVEADPRADEPATRIDEPATRIDEPATRIDEPVARAEAPASRFDEPATRVDTAASRAETPSPAPVDETSSDVWTSPPLAMGRAVDGAEFGELSREHAPDPRPAPRFTGTVLNKPARTGVGVGTWVTWILVVVALLVVILLLVMGVIGPGVVNSAGETSVAVLAALSPPELASSPLAPPALF